MRPIKFIARIIMQKKFLFLMCLFFMVSDNLTRIFVGTAIQNTFDNLTIEKSSYVIIRISLSMILLYSLRVVLFRIVMIVTVKARYFIESLLRRNIFNQIMDNPNSLSKDKTTGDVITILRDDVYIIEEYLLSTLDLISIIIYNSIAIVIMVKINVLMTILVFAPLIIYIILLKRFSNRLVNNREESREATSKVTSLIGEVFKSIELVQILNGEKNIIKQFHKVNENRRKYIMKDMIFSDILNFLMKNMNNISVGFILIIASRQLLNGNMSVGDFTLFLYYVTITTNMSGFLGYYFSTYHQINVSIDRMAVFFEGDTDKLVKKHDEEIKNESIKKGDFIDFDELSFKNVSFKYNDSDNGVEDVTFNLKKGTLNVITGRIGSGKSTLLKGILGLVKKQSGDIFIDNIKHDNEFMLYPIVAYSAQSPKFVSGTIRENIVLDVEKDEDAINKATSLAVFDRDIKEFNNGLDTLVGTNGLKLSGGQGKRLAAARMFVKEPSLYIFDDIISGLDKNTENMFWENLKKHNKTYLIATTNKKALEKADNIIVLKDGKHIADGKLHELLSTCNELKMIWESY